MLILRRAGAFARPACVRALVRLAIVAVLAVVVVGSVAAVAAAAGLPDGRGYELVSAAQKNGGDVIGDPARVRVADDGSAVGYASLSEFGDSAGGGVATDYLAVRSPAAGGQGWVTHGIIPPQTALSFAAVVNGFEPRYEQEFSPDLTSGVLFAWRPLTSDPLVANVANLYLRDDLRTVGGGDYSLVTGCPLCIGPLGSDRLTSAPVMVASTPDLGRVLFESALNLAEGAAGSALKLYEWDAGSRTVVLAGILPDGAGALDSAAGVGHGHFEHRHAISADGRKVFFIAAVGGVQNVYMRLDRTSTVQLNRPETSSPGSAQDARYGDASVDGSRVFFASGQRLTDDAPSGGGVYMYDTTLPDSDPHNLKFIASGDRIVDASADGRTVYFTAGVGLLPGEPPNPYGGSAMYAWHDGRLDFVANLPGDAIQQLTENPLGKTARVSPSGDLAFLSGEPSAANPAGSCPASFTRACDMLYLYTIATHRLACASCNPTGAPPATNGGVASRFVISAGGAAVTGHLARVITDDGRRAFFTTADALVPQDVNGKLDVYEYDVATATVNLISSGQSVANSYFMESTPSGDDALFFTREQLVGWDVDTNYDLYDARVGGGLPEPAPSPPACSGQDCRPAPPTPPSFAPATSQQAHTTGNLKSHAKVHAKRCRKGQTRKRVHGKTRCTKTRRRAKRASHAKHHRAARTRRSR